MMANEIKYLFSPITTDKVPSHNINCMNGFPFDKISDDELVSDLDKHKTHTSVQDKINELNNSSRYFENSTFRTTFNKYKNIFSILNANIRVCLQT